MRRILIVFLIIFIFACKNKLSMEERIWQKSISPAEWSERMWHGTVVFDNKIWLLGGYPVKNDIWYSLDGIKWYCSTLSAGYPLRYGYSTTVFKKKIWMIGGIRGDCRCASNDIWYSSDGKNWVLAVSDAGWSKRAWHTSVVFDNKIWVIGGSNGDNYYNDAWYW